MPRTGAAQTGAVLLESAFTRAARQPMNPAAVKDYLLGLQQRIVAALEALDGKPFGEYPVVALESVPVAGLVGRAWDSMRLWWKK